MVATLRSSKPIFKPVLVAFYEHYYYVHSASFTILQIAVAQLKRVLGSNQGYCRRWLLPDLFTWATYHTQRAIYHPQRAIRYITQTLSYISPTMSYCTSQPLNSRLTHTEQHLTHHEHRYISSASELSLKYKPNWTRLYLINTRAIFHLQLYMHLSLTYTELLHISTTIRHINTQVPPTLSIISLTLSTRTVCIPYALSYLQPHWTKLSCIPRTLSYPT